MIFASIPFIGLFLPIFLACYYLARPAWRSAVLLTFSYVFYAWWRVDFAFLLMGVTLFDYVLAKRLRNRTWLIFGISANLAVLAYFKYANFGLESFHALLGSAQEAPLTAWHIILPIGISFYILQGVSYLVDVYRRDCEPAEDFIDFAAYMAMFPQLIAGPVLRYKDVASQFLAREHSLERFNEGARRFCIGFCKKVLIADTLAPLVDASFAQTDPSMMDAWIGLLAYGMQLYFDFSGYSDMAIGLGLMLGFRFIENFNRPYLSRSITEFWRRWHISLSTWLKDYLYVPLGGNRKGARRTYINLMSVMVLGGLWHGASWNFVLWGAWHGIWLSLERLFLGKCNEKRSLFALLSTFILVLMGWVLFRAIDLPQAIDMYQGLLGMNAYLLSANMSWQVTPLMLFTLGVSLIITFFPRIVSVPSPLLILALFVAICKLMAGTHSPFLYFQF